MGCRISGPWLGDGMKGNGQNLSQVRPHDLQLQQTSDCSTQTERPWDAFRSQLVSAGPRSQSQTYTNRHCCGHMILPRDNPISTVSHSTENINRLPFRAARASHSVPKGQHCLLGCCSANMEEPPAPFLRQLEPDNSILEQPVGYLPLLHELDSGLGCTDGSFQQAEFSGMETEGMEDCTSRAGSSSSESFISSELSDSGFYSISTGEFRRFQRLLEKKIRLYRAQVARHGRPDPRERRELESIPEAQAFQPQGVCPTEVGNSMEVCSCTVGPSSVQSWKAESPCPSRCNAGIGPPFCLLSHPSRCSAPPCQQRAVHNHSSRGLLRRSNTLHRSAPPVTERRRASHPTFLGYSSATMKHSQRSSIDFLEGNDLAQSGQADWKTSSMPQGKPEEHRGFLPSGFGCDDGYKNSGEKQCKNISRGLLDKDWDRRFHTLGHSQDIHDTWSKLANRYNLGAGLYSTLDSHGPGSGKPRAQRNQLLKDRASQLADERSGATTDEDTHSEVRPGRYMSRTERRQQLQLAREQRLQEQARGGPGCRGVHCSTVLELSHRKLSRLQNRKLLDDWTTVEELLTHGNRLGSSQGVHCPASLLSVTTV